VIYVGTCGYSYKDWVGPFYPATIKPAEMLQFYAQRFSAVEIDATYYGVLSEKTVANMAARTPDNFRFCFKVPQTLTHGPVTEGRIHDDAALFRASVEPMQIAKKLGCALVQFPNAFRPGAQAESHVRRVVEALEGLAVVVEFRNAAWQNGGTFAMLSEIGAGWCNVDMPSLETLMAPGADASGPVGYVRFHGRNAAQWWTGTNVTRYAYDYRPAELEPWVDRIADVAANAQETFAFFNNHARGSAARDAETLEKMLSERYGPAARANLARPKRKAPTQSALPGIE
jgi:uncharacterized protein YecE (DUF72 family)